MILKWTLHGISWSLLAPRSCSAMFALNVIHLVNQLVRLRLKVAPPPVGKNNTSWWRHQMEPFSAILALCAGNSPVNGEFPAQRPVTQSFDVFFDQHLNKRLSKHSWDWWFNTPSRSLWRHCNGLIFNGKWFEIFNCIWYKKLRFILFCAQSYSY